MQITALTRASGTRLSVLRDNGADWSFQCPQLKIEASSLQWASSTSGLFCQPGRVGEMPELEAQRALYSPRSALQLLLGSWSNPHNPFPTSGGL